MAVIEVLKADITNLHYDILVNSAVEDLALTHGLSLVISQAGGPEIEQECQRIRERRGELRPGQVVVTRPGYLHASWLLHAVGPYWTGLPRNTYVELFDTYYNSMLLADELGARSIAFPNISTARRGFPRLPASRIVRYAVREALLSTRFIRRVCFVCHNDRNFELYHQIG